MTEAEAWGIFDRRARGNQGMSGQEFLDAGRSGKWEDVDQPGVMELVMLLPLAEHGAKNS